MAHFSYVGSGPYCYANSFAMMMGPKPPSTAVLEFATSSPFGMQFIATKEGIYFFDPYGWDPMQAFEDMHAAAGWTSKLTIGIDAADALVQLKGELTKGPVFVGPVEMGYLEYQPGNKGPIGADHYVVVLGIEGDTVNLHDPHGHPYASLPVSKFLQSWKTDSLGYGKSYMMRSDFKQIHQYTEEEIIRRALPNARKWLTTEMVQPLEMPPGSCGNGDAAEHLAQQIEKNFHPGIRNPLIYFAVRVGVRRLADAATCLGRIGYEDAAKIMAKQAKLVGALQYPLVKGDSQAAVRILRDLAPTYDELVAALQK
ncbi:hypothetical protein QQS21_006673 [Conoideocrella luteorostrata]|uniref:RADC family protein n=1 Tax=Conoideocrella luteorostrata TaxID=1105319 RepID=A0AAJ0CRH9_9HYPO|nr:hypothetical protein QQS21_006673 [Conoideocrella luteorostrata]